MPLYPARALERAMKIREVITRAMSGKINWLEAAEIIRVSPRQLRRWRAGWEKLGYDGLFDRRLGKPSPKRVPMETIAEVLRLYREKYSGFSVQHFHEMDSRRRTLGVRNVDRRRGKQQLAQSWAAGNIR